MISRLRLENKLAKRGAQLTAEQRERISACTDTATLESWLDNVIEAETAEDVFGGTPDDTDSGLATESECAR